ncbi:MAG: hypothetical protein MJ224_00200 [archaeon]|nr:hypothetical protein [archaeon]
MKQIKNKYVGFTTKFENTFDATKQQVCNDCTVKALSRLFPEKKLTTSNTPNFKPGIGMTEQGYFDTVKKLGGTIEQVRKTMSEKEISEMAAQHKSGIIVAFKKSNLNKEGHTVFVKDNTVFDEHSHPFGKFAGVVKDKKGNFQGMKYTPKKVVVGYIAYKDK